MTVSPLAGTLLPPSALVDVTRLVTTYFTRSADPADPVQRVSFGTSGHRGSSLEGTFNEAHILAISQAVCQHRRAGRGGRAAVHRHRHPRPVPARTGHRAGGVRRQRGGDGHRQA